MADPANFDDFFYNGRIGQDVPIPLVVPGDNATLPAPLRIPPPALSTMQPPNATSGPVGLPDPPWVEEWGEEKSPTFEFRDDGTSCVRTLLVPWDCYFAAVRSILGYPTVVAGKIQRHLPACFPDLTNSAGNAFLFCTQIRSVKGHAEPADGNTASLNWVSRYGIAELECVFETLTYSVLPDSTVPDEATWQRYVTVVTQPQASYLTLPQGSFIFADSTGPVPGSPGKVVPEYDLSATWHQVPEAAVPSKIVNPLITASDGPIELALGKVNLYDVLWNATTASWPTGNQQSIRFRRGTLLLVGANIKPIRSAIGDRVFDIEYKFKYLPVRTATMLDSYYAYGHNLLYWADPTGKTADGYKEVVSNFNGAESNYVLLPPGDNVNIYDFYDINNLFRVPA